MRNLYDVFIKVMSQKEYMNKLYLELDDYNINLQFTDNELTNGTNKLQLLSIYKDYINYNDYFVNRVKYYSPPSGKHNILYAIRYYEQFKCMDDTNAKKLCSNIVITSGATAAINYSLLYYRVSGQRDNILLVGLSYYIFKDLANMYNYDVKTIVNTNRNKIMPTVEQILDYLQNSKNTIVILTIPQNPSGEMYSEQQLEEIIRICKKTNSILLLDVCQMDEILFNKYININKMILELDAQDIVVVINSFSKTRSIPGGRYGYAYSGDEIVIKYIAYMNEYTDYCNSEIFEDSIILDMLFKVLYSCDASLRKIYIKKFKIIFLKSMGFERFNVVYKNILKEENIDKYLSVFVDELIYNKNIINKNYSYCCNKYKSLCSDGVVTELDGGFNCCIKLKKINNLSDKETVKKVADGCGIILFSQEDFCYSPSENDEFWVRVTLAIEEDLFKTKFDKFIETWFSLLVR